MGNTFDKFASELSSLRSDAAAPSAATTSTPQSWKQINDKVDAALAQIAALTWTCSNLASSSRPPSSAARPTCCWTSIFASAPWWLEDRARDLELLCCAEMTHAPGARWRAWLL